MSKHATQQIVESRDPLRWFSIVFLGLYGLSALAVVAHHGASKRHYLATLSLLYCYDLVCFAPRFAHFGTAAFYTGNAQAFNYPAFTAVMLRPLYSERWIGFHPYYSLTLIWESIAGGLYIRAMVRSGYKTLPSTGLTALVLLTSLPVLLMVYLHNFELVVWIVLAIGLWAYCTGRFWLASTCFGVAAALKYFPLILFGLFCNRKQWPWTVFGLGVFIGISFASLWILGPTTALAIKGLASQSPAFSAHYLYSWHPSEGSIDHSVYGYVKLLCFKLHRENLLPRIFPIYLAAAASLSFVLFVVRIRKQPSLNQLSALMILGIWVAPISHDYTLVNLIPVLGIFVLYALPKHRPEDGTFLRQVFICLAILLAPLHFVAWGGLSYGGPVRCVVLGILLALSLGHNLPSTLDRNDLAPA